MIKASEQVRDFVVEWAVGEMALDRGLELSDEVAQLEAETKRLRKIEYAANAAYNCWAGEGKASPQLMEALRKALGGE